VVDGATTLCGPQGTDSPGCLNTPACVCKGKDGCQPPCQGVVCAAGLVCARFGAMAGQCVENHCWLTGCEGCDRACNQGKCVDNACKVGACAASQVCRPSPDFTDYYCSHSCAGIQCGWGEVCLASVCVPGCPNPCMGNTVCNLATRTCETSKCAAPGSTCPHGGYCDPLTGACGNHPCEGVLCPQGQYCWDGQCYGPVLGQDAGVLVPDSGEKTDAAAAVDTGVAANDAQAPPEATPPPELRAGCTCDAAPGAPGATFGWLALAAMALLGVLRRRPLS
jgi:MYXO-CTERM domain-containing protein